MPTCLTFITSPFGTRGPSRPPPAAGWGSSGPRGLMGGVMDLLSGPGSSERMFVKGPLVSPHSAVASIGTWPTTRKRSCSSGSIRRASTPCWSACGCLASADGVELPQPSPRRERRARIEQELAGCRRSPARCRSTEGAPAGADPKVAGEQGQARQQQGRALGATEKAQ